MLTAWTITIVGFFSLSWFKLDTYIFPAAPAVCLLAANAWRQASEDPQRHPAVRGVLVVLPIALALGGVAVWVFLFRLNLPIPTYTILLPLSLIVGGTVLAVQTARAGWRPPALGLALIVSLVCAYGTVVAAGLPVIDQTRPTPQIARWMAATAPESTAPVGLYQLERWKSSLRFYSGHVVAPLETPEELTAFLDAHPGSWIVLTERDAARLARQGLKLTTVFERSAVLGTEGRGLRRQRWGNVVVAVRATP